jgi:ABC-2 type transport system ATP-binding protein
VHASLSNDQPWAINLSNVEKLYAGSLLRPKSRVHALRGIDMRVRSGEIFGLLGPNGAGKSTLVKILMTVIRPTRAEGTMLGHPIGHKPTLARVGYLPEHHRFPDYLTGKQVVDFYAAMSGVSVDDRKRRTPELLDLVGMARWSSTRVRGYSKGMRQRIGIAQALASNPSIVVLDEPTDGVDPVGRRDIREMLLRIKDRGTTVFLNSHLLSELELICDRVAILVQGKVSSQGTIEELTLDRQRYEVEVTPLDADPAVLLRALAQRGVLTPSSAGTNQPTLRTGEAVTTIPTGLEVATTDPIAIQPLLDALRQERKIIRTVRAVRPTLEDLFMEAIQDPTTGAALPPGAAR